MSSSTNSAILPVKEMVLYKHGVGFFVREGAVNAEEVALTFHQDDINDVLKSLAIFDRGGGQILGIHYQTPMDKNSRLANSSIRLSTEASVIDLLRDLRGRQASLSVENTPGTVETLVGRVIGADQQKGELLGVDPLAGILVSVLTEDGQVRIFRLTALRSLTIQDTQSQHDLSYFLDTSTSEDTRRLVTIRLSAGEHQLVVNYVAPSPTWRVSYRVVAELEEGAENGNALLQGWGLFDNRLEEDLENVQVTLVAGQPISFIYELYASRIPKRPTVQDETRVAPGPVEFDGDLNDLRASAFEDSAMPDFLAAAPQAASAPSGFGGRPLMRGAAPAPAQAQRTTINRLVGKISEISDFTPITVQGKESAEFFQYVVTMPVTVKRGESALVPIIGSEVAYRRELLYNGAKLPQHPVVALRFSNKTGLTLERGPVTVVENGDYKGEAVVPFTKDGNEVYLPYAVELGVRVVERTYAEEQTVGLSISNAYLVFDEYRIFQTVYAIENRTATALTIAIEASITTGQEIFEMATPDVETATERRWRVNAPAHAKTEFVRKERQRVKRQEQVRQQSYQQLQHYLAERWLDQDTFAHLAEILAALASVQTARNDRDRLTAERKTVYEKQEQLRANLNALQPSGEEATLRKRMLGQLEFTQDRLEEIERRIETLTKQMEDSETRANEMIAALGGEVPPSNPFQRRG